MRRTRSRVLIIIKGLGLGGAERIVEQQILNGDRSSFDYSVAVVDSTAMDLAPSIKLAGAELIDLGGGPGTWPFQLLRVLRRGHFDVVHSQSPVAAAVARVIARFVRPRPRIVTTVHVRPSDLRRETCLVLTLTRKLDDATVAVSRWVADALPGRARVVNHGVDVDAVRAAANRSAARASMGLTCADVVIGAVANFRPQKRHEDWLAVAQQVAGSLPSARFVLVGEGPRRKEIEALAHALGLDDCVSFLGVRPDAVKLMSGFDAFLLTSAFEGLPISVIEALVLGVPIVATDVGGIGEVARDGVESILRSPGDIDGLASAVIHLFSDPAIWKTFSAHCRTRGQQMDVADAVRQVEAIYREILGHPAGCQRGDDA